MNYDNALDYDARFTVSNGSGNGTASVTLTASGGFICSGNITAYSDIALKENLVIVDGALDKIGGLTGYSYDRKDTGDAHVGLIAQDVQAVLPNAVLEGEYLGIHIMSVVALLVNGINELKAEVDELRKED
tara:strand:- start:6025 stop:6417 length:393 start_codon:yes stop_codon:yes gene_type:complete